jgi:hypothetical protein
MAQTRDAGRKSRRFAQLTKDNFTSLPAARFAERAGKLKGVLDSLALRARSDADFNEAVYRSLVALADLERITAGGLHLAGPCPAPETAAVP